MDNLEAILQIGRTDALLFALENALEDLDGTEPEIERAQYLGAMLREQFDQLRNTVERQGT